jgi:hypothetical protein
MGHVEPGYIVSHKKIRHSVVRHRANLDRCSLLLACEFPRVAEQILQHHS